MLNNYVMVSFSRKWYHTIWYADLGFVQNHFLAY